jgi:hypothetical protein
MSDIVPQPAYRQVKEQRSIGARTIVTDEVEAKQPEDRENKDRCD